MGAITYNALIPQATDQLSQSQPLILQNFTAIDQLIAIDHATFASVNAGFHNKVTLPTQTPQPTFPGTDIGLYAFIPTSAPLTTVAELFVCKQDGTNVPMTAAKQNARGYAMLPSGMVMKWGITSTVGTAVSDSFDTTIPFSAVYSMTATPSNANTTVVQITSLITTGFVASVTGTGTKSFYWIAIGLAAL